MPQRTGEKYSAKKRFDLFLLLICLLLVVNTLYLMNMQAQMNRMAKSLSQIASSLTASIRDAENSVGPAPTQQEKTVASSRYQSAPEEAVKIGRAHV